MSDVHRQTMNLRIVSVMEVIEANNVGCCMVRKREEIQQEWIDLRTGKSEWRRVPKVERVLGEETT